MKPNFITIFLSLCLGLSAMPMQVQGASYDSIFSQNRAYQATLQSEGDAGVNAFRLTVAPADRLHEPLWQSDFLHSDYFAGILSDDGSAFVFVNDSYQDDEPVVTIYHRGEDIYQIIGRRFELSAAQMEQTPSHRLWLARTGITADFMRRNDHLWVRIVTMGGRQHLINTATGEFGETD